MKAKINDLALSTPNPKKLAFISYNKSHLYKPSHKRNNYVNLFK